MFIQPIRAYNTHDITATGLRTNHFEVNAPTAIIRSKKLNLNQ